MNMKEEALKLADESQRQSSLVYLAVDEPIAKQMAQMFLNYSALIRRLVEELDKQTKPLSEKELYEVFDKCYPNNGDGDVVTLVDFARAIEERHGIK